MLIKLSHKLSFQDHNNSNNLFLYVAFWTHFLTVNSKKPKIITFVEYFTLLFQLFNWIVPHCILTVMIVSHSFFNNCFDWVLKDDDGTLTQKKIPLVNIHHLIVSSLFMRENDFYKSPSLKIVPGGKLNKNGMKIKPFRFIERNEKEQRWNLFEFKTQNYFVWLQIVSRLQVL